MPSMFIHLANAQYGEFPSQSESWMWKSSLICRSTRLRQGVLLLLGCVERRSGTGFHTPAALRMSTTFTHTHTHTHRGHRYVPGPVGNPCLAKELSEPLRSPVSLTRVEKAWAAGEEWEVEWVSLCISGFRHPLLANYRYATALERALLQRQMNYDFVLMRGNWRGRASSVGISYLLEMSVVGVPILVRQNDLENLNDWTTLPTMHQDPADGDALQACISNWDVHILTNEDLEKIGTLQKWVLREERRWNDVQCLFYSQKTWKLEEMCANVYLLFLLLWFLKASHYTLWKPFLPLNKTN